MQFIQGKNRTQSILFTESLDQIISPDNEVRMIELFVESINLSDFKSDSYRTRLFEACGEAIRSVFASYGYRVACSHVREDE